MSDLPGDAYERLLDDVAAPDAVRRIEGGASAADLWSRLEASGFVDALVPESAGGAGLSLAEAFPLFVTDGRHALPLPAAHTMLVRAVLVRDGIEFPPGAIAIASRSRVEADDSVTSLGTPYGLVADWVVVSNADGWRLLKTTDAARSATGVHGSLRADLHWPAAAAAASGPRRAVAWPDAGAVLTAAQMAGAMTQALQASVTYAEQRVQFGRSIGKFQAIQHQLAVMAEQVFAAHVAAEIGCAGDGPLPQPLRAALAKARGSEAAALVTSIAHAVHGAIGVTAELDLHILTRRLHEWRADFGAEQYWNRVLGQALLGPDAGSTLAFMHAHLIPHEEARR